MITSTLQVSGNQIRTKPCRWFTEQELGHVIHHKLVMGLRWLEDEASQDVFHALAVVQEVLGHVEKVVSQLEAVPQGMRLTKPLLILLLSNLSEPLFEMTLISP